MLYLLLLYHVLGDQIYPTVSTKNIQLENSGWIDCISKAEILPTNCQGDDLMWLECYDVPKNGLCSKQNIQTGNSDTLNFGFTFYKAEATNSDIEINGQSFSKPMTVQQNITRVILQSKGSSVSIKIKNTGLKFTGLTISKDCLPFCQSCADNFCSLCQTDSFYQYNYRCTRNECDNQTAILSTKSLKSSSGYINNGNYIVDMSFDFTMGDCLVPKVYYTYGLQNSQIKLILDQTQVAYNTSNGLSLTLPLDQVIKNCEEINGTTAYTYSCYIGVSVTNQFVTQYMLILVGQISVNKQTNATEQFTQSVSIPSDMNVSVGPVFIVSETVSVAVNQEKKLFTVFQTISDPQFSNFQISYGRAYVEQGNTTYNLTLNMQLQQGVTTKFLFNWKSDQFDSTQAYNLVVNSLAQPKTARRRLDTPLNREALNVNYKAQNTYVYNIEEGIAVPKIDDGIMVAIIVGSFAGVVLLIIVVSAVLKKNS